MVRQDIRDIKEEFAPLKAAVSVVGKFTSRKKGIWLLTSAADKVIDLLVKKLILSRSGWLTKLAVPFLMKNFSSHVIAENKDAIIATILSFFTKKDEKEEPPAPDEEQEPYRYETEED